jgi:hypothetical protein
MKDLEAFIPTETLMDRTMGMGALIISAMRWTAGRHGGTLYTDEATNLVDCIALPKPTVHDCRQEMADLLTNLQRLFIACSYAPESCISLS